MFKKSLYTLCVIAVCLASWVNIKLARAIEPAFRVENIGQNECKITRYLGRNEEVSVPSEINGRKVVSIGYNAFDSCR